MAEDLEARVSALENELEMLRKVVASLSLESVGGDLTISYSAPGEQFSLRVDSVGGDVSVGVSGPAERIAVDTDDVGGDFGFSSSGHVETVSISTEDVGGDVVCTSGGKLSVTTGDVAGAVTSNEAAGSESMSVRIDR